MTASHRLRPRALRTRFAVLPAIALLAASPLAGAHEWWAKAAGCDNLASVPLNINVDYPTQVRPIWNNRGCNSCHNASSMIAGFDISGSVVSELYELVNRESSQSTPEVPIFRVIPGDPERSLIRQKVNCDEPDVGNRMPSPSNHLPLAEQALIWDWIAQGARGLDEDDMPVSPVIFLQGMESTR